METLRVSTLMRGFNERSTFAKVPGTRSLRMSPTTKATAGSFEYLPGIEEFQSNSPSTSYAYTIFYFSTYLHGKRSWPSRRLHICSHAGDEQIRPIEA